MNFTKRFRVKPGTRVKLADFDPDHTTGAHVMSGLNPQGCRVISFKTPSFVELSHDFLWRIHHAVPARGEMGIFNRSHYEDVLIVRVHQLVSKDAWSRRYEQ